MLAGLIAMALMFALVQLGAIALAFVKLGLSVTSAAVLLLCALAGSAINLPLLNLRSQPWPRELLPESRFPDFTLPPYTGSTTLAVNIGGGLIPTAFCGYLLIHQPLPLRALVAGIALVSLACYLLSGPTRRFGLPVLVAPLLAALVGTLAAAGQSAPTAYVCGTLGMLIGGELLRLKDVVRQRVPRTAVGGAGAFDGVFLAGVIAALLA